MPRVAAAGTTLAGTEARVSWRSSCSFAGVSAAWASVTFDLQHEVRDHCARACEAEATELAAVQRGHSFCSPPTDLLIPQSVTVRAHAQALDAGPGKDNKVSAR